MECPRLIPLGRRLAGVQDHFSSFTITQCHEDSGSSFIHEGRFLKTRLGHSSLCDLGPVTLGLPVHSQASPGLSRASAEPWALSTEDTEQDQPWGSALDLLQSCRWVLWS
jgi:hypothetical protein